MIDSWFLTPLWMIARWGVVNGQATGRFLLTTGRFFLRPIRIFVLSIECQLQKVGAVDAHPVDLPLAAAVGLEGDPFAVGRPCRLLVRAFAGQDAAGAVCQVGDAD